MVGGQAESSLTVIPPTLLAFGDCGDRRGGELAVLAEQEDAARIGLRAQMVPVEHARDGVLDGVPRGVGQAGGGEDQRKDRDDAAPARADRDGRCVALGSVCAADAPTTAPSDRL